MWGPCDFLYGVVRNALWDDPAVAVTGRFAKNLAAQSEEARFSSGLVGPYLVWRFSYLLVGLVFGSVRVVLATPWLRGAGKGYEAFLEKQLPAAVPKQRFNGLVDALEAIDVGVWVLAVISLLGTLAALLCALPTTALMRVKLSRRVAWCTWLVGFLPPFLLFLAFPLRSVVRWDAVTADVCAFSIQGTFKTPGSQLQRSLVMLSKVGALEESMQGLAGNVNKWCLKNGEDWHKSFYNQSVPCVWMIEDRCRELVCSQAPESALVKCLQECVSFAVDNTGATARAAVMTAARNCGPEAGASYTPTAPGTSWRSAQSASTSDLMELYNTVLAVQRSVVIDSAQVMTLASTQAEYVVGVLIAVVIGQNLLSAALGLAGGLSEALINLKAMFPGNQTGGWLLILTTFQVVPTYMVIFAVFQQMLGDPLVGTAVILATLFLSVSMHTGYRITRTTSGESGRDRVYSLIWVEYGLRAVLGLALIAVLVLWVLRKGLGEDLVNYVQEELLSPRTMAAAVADFFTRKAVTAVAGTDAMLSAFVQTEVWREQKTPQEVEAHETAVADLNRLASPFKAQPVPV